MRQVQQFVTFSIQEPSYSRIIYSPYILTSADGCPESFTHTYPLQDASESGCHSRFGRLVYSRRCLTDLSIPRIAQSSENENLLQQNPGQNWSKRGHHARKHARWNEHVENNYYSVKASYGRTVDSYATEVHLGVAFVLHGVQPCWFPLYQC